MVPILVTLKIEYRLLKADVGSQTTLLYMKRFNKTLSFLFLFFCLFFVSKSNLLDFYWTLI